MYPWFLLTCVCLLMFLILFDRQGGIQQLRGPNFTQFWPPTRPPWVDNYGHFTYYQIFVHVTKRGLSKDHLPTSFCPRSYWMPPSAENIQFLFWQHYHHIILTSTTTCLWRVQFRQNRIFFLLCEQKKIEKNEEESSA